MRVLFYGGCHASAMRRIVDRHGRVGDSADHLTNFLLIQRGTPFPYERLDEFDLVVFTPIINQGQWNTAHLEERCAALGVDRVKVPWLEWHGYFPQSEKADLGWHSEWRSSALANEAASHATFAAFFDAVVEGDVLAEAAHRTLAETTTYLKGLETASSVDIRISDFIAQEFRARRLFLTPDHAATPLYHHVMRELEVVTGLRLDRSFYHSATETQQGYQTPILPSVARALDLQFVGADYEHQEFARGHVLSLSEYLSVVYAAKDVFLLRATARTRAREQPGGDVVECPSGSRLVVRHIERRAGGYDLVEVIAQPGVPVHGRRLLGRRTLVYRGHWAATAYVRDGAFSAWPVRDPPVAPRYPVDPSRFAGLR